MIKFDNFLVGAARISLIDASDRKIERWDRIQGSWAWNRNQCAIRPPILPKTFFLKLKFHTYYTLTIAHQARIGT